MHYRDESSIYFTASINEIVDGAEKRVNRGHGTPGILFHDPKWLGHPEMRSWQDARRIFNSPWPKGMNLVGEMQRKLADIEMPKPKSSRRRMAFNDCAGEVCIDRAMRGELEVFRDAKKREVIAQRVLRLIIPMCFASRVNADTILWNAAAATAVADILEESGRAVELCCVFGSDGGFRNTKINKFGVLTTLKEAGEPINLAATVNCLSPWFFRVFMFSCQDGHGVDVCNGRGMPVYQSNQKFYERMWEKLEVPSNTDTIMMPSIGSFEAARNFVSEMIQAAE